MAALREADLGPSGFRGLQGFRGLGFRVQSGCMKGVECGVWRRGVAQGLAAGSLMFGSGGVSDFPLQSVRLRFWILSLAYGEQGLLSRP